MTFSHDILKKRIIVFGSNGMLGQRTTEFYLRKENIQLLCSSAEDDSFIPNTDYVKCDISVREEVKRVILDFCPDIIINAAAYTNVDKSETERETAWKINVRAVEYIAEAARVIDAQLIHISTDYIFDGKYGPYTETAKPNPLGYYGRTKLASENALKISGIAHTILRTNVLYGVAAHGRPDFVKWVVSSLRSGQTIRIVTDQVGNPTYIDDLVQAISKVIEYRKTGIFNIGGIEFLSRFDFTLRIADFFDLEKNLVMPILTSDLNQAARRPLKSGLVTLKAESQLGYKPHTITESLSLMKRELGL